MSTSTPEPADTNDLQRWLFEFRQSVDKNINKIIAGVVIATIAIVAYQVVTRVRSCPEGRSVERVPRLCVGRRLHKGRREVSWHHRRTLGRLEGRSPVHSDRGLAVADEPCDERRES